MTSGEPHLIILTPAQRRVLGELTRDGADNAVIAQRLGLAIETVKRHVKSLLVAFNVPNRTAIVAACLNGGIRVRTVASPRRQSMLDTRPRQLEET